MMPAPWKEYGTNWGKLWSSWGPLCQIFIAFFFFLGSLLNLLNIVSVLCFGIFGHKARGIWVGIEPTPSALEGEVLTTGLPGNPPDFYCCWVDSVVSCFR